MLTVTADSIRAMVSDEAAIVKLMIERSKDLHDQSDSDKRRVLLSNYKQVVQILTVTMPAEVASKGPFQDEAALSDYVRCALFPVHALIVACEEILSTQGSA